MGVISGREIYDREKEMEREAGSDEGEGIRGRGISFNPQRKEQVRILANNAICNAMCSQGCFAGVSAE